MSNDMRRLVENTWIKGLSTKCVLIHMADTVRDDYPRFWQSQVKMAARLGTDPKTIRRQLRHLLKLGLIEIVGEKECEGGVVHVYEIMVECLLALPCIEAVDSRPEFAQKHKFWGRGSEPEGVGASSLKGRGLRARQSIPLHTSHTSA